MKKRIFGLDFSGARDAGRRIWLAEGRQKPEGLEILNCLPAEELPGGGVERAAALAALRTFILGLGAAIIGCDFPFSLPRCLIKTHSWEDFIARFTHLDADAFRADCRRQRRGAQPKEPKRLTDDDSKTPWCAFNIRLFHQSYHGIGHVLRPLVTAAKVVVLPMQLPMEGLPWLIETCPASTLKDLGWQGSYKGRDFREKRGGMLGALVKAKLLCPLPATIEQRAIENAGGDALDSIIAALATGAALREILQGSGGGDRLEGRVYFRLR